MTTKVYYLSHPVTGDIVYVGKCVTSLKVRRTGHEHKARSGRSKTPLGDWIRDLQSQGLLPVISLLEENPSGRWQDAECAWIARLRSDGHALLNLTPGGNGAHTRAALALEFVSLLGRISDARIAEQAGLCREIIKYHRSRAGIPAAKDTSRREGTFPKGQVPHNKTEFCDELIS